MLPQMMPMPWFFLYFLVLVVFILLYSYTSNYFSDSISFKVLYKKSFLLLEW